MQRTPLINFQMRAPRELFDIVDDWRRQQVRIPTAAEAVRQLITIGLEADAAKARRTSDKAA